MNNFGYMNDAYALVMHPNHRVDILIWVLSGSMNASVKKLCVTF